MVIKFTYLSYFQRYRYINLENIFNSCPPGTCKVAYTHFALNEVWRQWDLSRANLSIWKPPSAVVTGINFNLAVPGNLKQVSFNDRERFDDAWKSNLYDRKLIWFVFYFVLLIFVSTLDSNTVILLYSFKKRWLLPVSKKGRSLLLWFGQQLPKLSQLLPSTPSAPAAAPPHECGQKRQFDAASSRQLTQKVEIGLDKESRYERWTKPKKRKKKLLELRVSNCQIIRSNGPGTCLQIVSIQNI